MSIQPETMYATEGKRFHTLELAIEYRETLVYQFAQAMLVTHENMRTVKHVTEYLLGRRADVRLLLDFSSDAPTQPELTQPGGQIVARIVYVTNGETFYHAAQAISARESRVLEFAERMFAELVPNPGTILHVRDYLLEFREELRRLLDFSSDANKLYAEFSRDCELQP